LDGGAASAYYSGSSTSSGRFALVAVAREEEKKKIFQYWIQSRDRDGREEDEATRQWKPQKENTFLFAHETLSDT
jgi:hypothetical protein